MSQTEAIFAAKHSLRRVPILFWTGENANAIVALHLHFIFHLDVTSKRKKKKDEEGNGITRSKNKKLPQAEAYHLL